MPAQFPAQPFDTAGEVPCYALPLEPETAPVEPVAPVEPDTAPVEPVVDGQPV